MNLPQLQQNFNTQKAIDRWVDMWKTNDMTLVDKLFISGPELTYFSSEIETLMQGLDAVREHHKNFGFVDGGKETSNKLWVEDLYSVSLGTTAVVTGIWFFRKNAWQTQKGPFTFVYTHGGNDFLLAHVHFGKYV